MRIGLICSAGGSPIAAIQNICPHVEFVMVTDRPCGAEELCQQRKIPYKRLEHQSNHQFSLMASDFFLSQNPPDLVLLLFSRFITEPLLSSVPVLNIHPSLLPAFKGMGALKKTLQSGAKFFGTTLHIANEKLDEGMIIAQACQPISPGDDIKILNRKSYLHKVCLILLMIDLLENQKLKFEYNTPMLNVNLPVNSSLSPFFLNPIYHQFVLDHQIQEGISFL